MADIMVMGIHARLAELHSTNKRRPLTEAELQEMMICLDANANWVWKMIKLENLSMLASRTNDMDWLHEICARIDEMMYTDKKPGHKAAD